MGDETYPYQSKLLAEYEARGEARALLTVIESRGLPITERQRLHIENCDDRERLMAWLKRAAVIPSVADILG